MYHGLVIGMSGVPQASQARNAAPPANNAPVVDLNGATGGIDIAQTFTEGDSTLSLCLAATVTDTDSDPLVSMTIIGADFTADDEIVKLGSTPVEFPVDTNLTSNVTGGSTTFAVVFTTSNKTWSITKDGGGTAATAEWQSLLRTLAYVNDSVPVTSGDRTLTVTVNDGTSNSAAAVMTLTVASHVGDAWTPTAPVNVPTFTYDAAWDRTADIDVDSDYTGDLQAAIEAAVALADSQSGDVIVELTSGSTYNRPSANFKTYRLPQRATGKTNWIVIRSSSFGTSPAVANGTRITTSDVSDMAVLQQTAASGLPIIATDGPASYYRLIGLYLEAPGDATDDYALFRMGAAYPNHVTSQDWELSSSLVETIADLPHNIVIDRCLIRSSDDTLANGVVYGGILLDAATTAILDSEISNIKSDGSDSQAIQCFSGTGPFLIRNNKIEGSGECLIFGGDTMRFANTTPADIHITENWFTKNTDWEISDIWNVKNLLELKHAKRVKIDANVFSNSWAGNQQGEALVFTPRNQTYRYGTHDGANNAATFSDSTMSLDIDVLVGCKITNSTDGSSGTITANTATTITATLSGGAQNDWDVGDSALVQEENPWAQVRDVEVTNNLFKNVAVVARISAEDDLHPSLNTQRIRIHNNVAIDVSKDRYPSPRFIWHAAFAAIDTPSEYLTVEHNTFLFVDSEAHNADPTYSGYINIDNIGGVTLVSDNLRFRNNIVGQGRYGALNLSDTTGDENHHYNVIMVRPEESGYPPGSDPSPNYYANDAAGVSWNDYAGGNYTLSSLSRFKSGGTADASDGSDQGADWSDVVDSIAGVESGLDYLHIDIDQSSPVAFDEGDPDITVFGSNIRIVDQEGLGLTECTMILSGFADGNDESLTIGATTYPLGADDTGSASAGSTTFAIDYTSGLFSVTKSGGGSFPVADAITLLEAVEYGHSGAVTTGQRLIVLQVANNVTTSAEAVAVINAVGVVTLPDPVSHWALNDNAANTTVADSFGSNTLTLQGGDNTSAKSVTGQVDNAFQFNGTDDYCSRTTVVGYRAGAFTVALWVKGAAQSDTKVFGNGNNPNTNHEFSIGTGSSTTSKCRVRIRNNNGTYALQVESTTTVFDSTWHHIAFVNDGDGNARLYIDGVEDATNFDFAHVDTVPNRTSIGAHLRSSAAGFFSGSIDDVRVYDVALSQPQVEVLAAMP